MRYMTKLFGKPLRAIGTKMCEKSYIGQELNLDGKNPMDWAIRSQAPKTRYDKGMEKVQRLNGCGSEVIDHHQ